ncbi:MAG TPA: chitobiase/beta-hexosaminidase C-terminal domain-containing protein, partial [bacterium]
TPVFSLSSGAYSQEISVTICCATDNALIRFTMDSSEPTEKSTLYKEPIKIHKTTTIKAKAFKQDGVSSYIAVAEYIISTP